MDYRLKTNNKNNLKVQLKHTQTPDTQADYPLKIKINVKICTMPLTPNTTPPYALSRLSLSLHPPPPLKLCSHSPNKTP